MNWLERVRDTTREAHEALHHHPLLAPLSGTGLTRARLGSILQAFDVYYRSAEAAITMAVPADLPHAPVRDWLAKDMAALDIAPLDVAFYVPPINTPSRLIGYLYTKQGSTLGGRVISKHIERQLGLLPLTDQRFFAGYGPENGAHWKRFTDYVSAHEAGLDHDQVITAACEAFDGIGRACDQVFTRLSELTSVSH
ncbi:biliverdin-producing heme oxygenase [Asticcacaulis sp. ZE23SCel15]|uniref:biliverdin-producing heme oxygenase n=1 Tax=Asticcacaulis sp. ZE23SCel15 TaxID=3059027 RepID=UPI00265FBE18|nr:biliverdin-producing heme oxygenase [Asticcacaulis sp. ZE23SCel15]WKL57666.1 biliverdin-producing heme oxygenase [Asticcacaulis sp. ZE23SCel15]